MGVEIITICVGIAIIDGLLPPSEIDKSMAAILRRFSARKSFWDGGTILLPYLGSSYLLCVFGECGTKVWRHSPKKPPSGDCKK